MQNRNRSAWRVVVAGLISLALYTLSSGPAIVYSHRGHQEMLSIVGCVYRPIDWICERSDTLDEWQASYLTWCEGGENVWLPRKTFRFP